MSYPRRGARVCDLARLALAVRLLAACSATAEPQPSLRQLLRDDGVVLDDARHAAAATALARLSVDDEALRALARQTLAEAGAPASLVAVVRGDDPTLRQALARLAPVRCGQAAGAPGLLVCSRVRVEFVDAPTRLAVGQPLRVEGRVLGGARLHEVLLQTPAGAVLALPPSGQGRSFVVEQPPPHAAGGYTLEVMIRAERGLEVAALWDLQIGEAPSPEPEPDAVDPTDGDAPLAARRAFDLLQRDRQAAGQAALDWSPTLASQAQARADELAGRDVLEHIERDPTALVDQAGSPLVWLGENLARARSVQGARRALQHSPSHRRNRLHPLAQQAGVGAAWRGVGDARTLFLVELLARPGPGLDAGELLRGLGQRVNQARNAAGVRALNRDPDLEQQAQQHAQRMCDRQALLDADPEGASLTRAVLDARADLVRAGAALYAVPDAATAQVTPALLDARYDVMGVGVVHCALAGSWYAVVLVAARDGGAAGED